jgi:hypothetical protein
MVLESMRSFQIGRNVVAASEGFLRAVAHSDNVEGGQHRHVSMNGVLVEKLIRKLSASFASSQLLLLICLTNGETAV